MVAIDEPLLEVSTDKVDTEIPSPVAGILTKIVVGVDQTVAVGAELAVIADSAGASAPAPAAPVAAPVVAAPVAPTPPPAAPVAAPAASSGGTVITMPALGESVSEGTVTRWLKNVGDSVAVDEALLEVSTDKVDTEIPSPVAGTLLAIDVAVDTTVAVGARLALIGVSGSAPVAATPPAAPAPVAAAPTPPPAPVAEDRISHIQLPTTAWKYYKHARILSGSHDDAGRFACDEDALAYASSKGYKAITHKSGGLAMYYFSEKTCKKPRIAKSMTEPGWGYDSWGV
jgi:pyruvate/2-oxoglutarate dehydrogenase complex dihydrolipoamide acyltransferase (E2) component